jgi:FdhD protein
MVEKTASFGARTLVAISAPTSLAIKRAQTLDIALIAIARRDTVTIFNGADRLIQGRI